MRAHAGTQHLGRPQRRRAFQRDHLSDTERRGAAQDAAHVARILQPVEHDAGDARLDVRRGTMRKHEADARR